MTTDSILPSHPDVPARAYCELRDKLKAEVERLQVITGTGEAAPVIAAASSAIRLAMQANAVGRGGKYEVASYLVTTRQKHILKAIRHAVTALMQIRGIEPRDGEEHLDNALTRLAMARAAEDTDAD